MERYGGVACGYIDVTIKSSMNKNRMVKQVINIDVVNTGGATTAQKSKESTREVNTKKKGTNIGERIR